jgi:hypothetical protein
MMLRKMAAPGLAVIFLAAGMGLTACGGDDGGVSKSALVAKIKEDPELKDMPDKQLDCVAGVYIKYGDKKQLKDIIDGKMSADQDVKGLERDNKKVESEMLACLK